MRRLVSIGLLSSVALVAMGDLVHPAAAAERLIVELSDGRRIQGEIDAESDQQTLWLRVAVPRIIVIMPVDWEHIVRARLDDRELSGAQLRQYASRVLSKRPRPVFVLPGNTSGRAEASPVAGAERIRSLDIEVTVANWDADFENDGLQVRIYPRSARGGITPVDGTLNVRLIGRDLFAARSRPRFPDIGRWSVRVDAEDFDAYGATYQIPFQKIHPEFDLDVDYEGEVKAALNVSGQGRFEAATSLRLRTRSPLRDDVELWERTRTLPGEVIHR